MRSAPLVKLDEDTCVAIDELIDVFLEQNVPSEISKWEEDTSYVWMSMMSLVHLAFAAGKEYYCKQMKISECDTAQSQDPYFLKTESKQSNATITEFNKAESETSRSENREGKRKTVFLESKKSEAFVIDLDEADKDDMKEFQSSLYHIVENHETSCKRRKIEGRSLFAISDNTEIKTSVSEDKNCDEKPIHMARLSINTKTWNLFSDAHVFIQREPALGANRESPSILGVSVVASKA